MHSRSYVRWFNLGWLFLSCWASVLPSWSEPGDSSSLRLGTPFSDHMVIQADVPIRVWGWDRPGTAVKVTIADQQADAIAQEAGRWEVELPAMSDVGPHEMVVEGSSIIRLVDVVMGDVWWCAGQSNMGVTIGKTADTQTYAEPAIQSSKDPMLRLLKLPSKLSDKPLDMVDANWMICNPANVRNFSAVAFFFGRELRKNTDRPIGLIQCASGGTPIVAFLSPQRLSQHADYQLLKRQRAEGISKADELRRQWEENGRRGPEPQWAAGRPQAGLSVFYNGTIHSMFPFAVKGALWYHGESNTTQAAQYPSLFQGLVEEWRQGFRAPQMPVYFVQLPNYLAKMASESWPVFRETQRQIERAMPHTAMAVSIDVGDAYDIHPMNKRPVGERLALLALHNTYGRTDLLAYSPRPIGASADARGRVHVRLDHVGNALRTSNDAPAVLSFELSTDGKEYKPAQAQIFSADTLEVWTDAIPNPAYVRYAYAPDPSVNLVNSASLPATPFELMLEPQ